MKQPLARKIHQQVKSHFIWTSDMENYGVPEHWRSYADEIEKGDVIRDDCDAFALTCAELLIRQDADKNDIYLIFCLTETGGGHLICVYDGWVLDNRQRDIIAWDKLPYTFIKSMQLAEVGTWRKC